MKINDDLETIKYLFSQVSNGDKNFEKWLDLKLPAINFFTPRQLIQKGQADIVVNLLGSFLPRPRLP